MAIYTRVTSPATKLYSLKFVVEGRGYFPTDMLRYDQCYPDTQSDSAAVGDGSYIEGARRVVLCTENYNKNWQPNVARWASFSWRVLPEAALDEPLVASRATTEA